MFKISVIFSVRSTSELCMLFICVVFVSILLTYCSLRFSVSSSFIVISVCSSLSTIFRKSISGSQIKNECDALFFVAIFCNCVFRFIIKFSFIFVFLLSCVLKEDAFLSNVLVLTSSCLIVSLGSIRISLLRLL